MEFSKRMRHFETGVFSALSEMKRERTARGESVIDFSIGSPNIPPARHVVDALSRGVQDPGSYEYAITDGEELLDAVCTWYRRRYGVELEHSEITSLLGSQDGLAHLSLAIADPGDLVLVPDPGYPIFGDGPLLAGAELYRMPQKEENGWIVDLNAVPEEAAKRAKLMVVSYPNNPVTSIAPPSFYRELVDFAKTYDIIVLHDNAYSELVFDGARCGSFLETPGAKEVGIEFNSLSKTYGLAGARIGFAVGNRSVISKLKALKSNLDYGMFLPVQKAAVAALTGPQDCVERTRAAYERRRDVLVEGLNAAGWEIPKPRATMFVWAKIPAPYSDSAAFVGDLFQKTGVLVTPGSAFGPSGEGHVRMALVRSEEEMGRAVRAIERSGILKQG
ncbi:aminotransferase class I/II-fold pyridoxal phosphate-dependent enzyme [Caproicibacter sp. BJN0012]|uniref:aminotransferase class I/II-fold pyridoxal phosphate-dependent enzyme n=1 Tax=Caproicibacter sp. BJN0012 TaxID=3110227 RepID=UPI002E16578D|nr:aminotransferase class I/II-fold pyridoxal phosphate-dependent enzyme [Caproicibacter sp. BJN0012]